VGSRLKVFLIPAQAEGHGPAIYAVAVRDPLQGECPIFHVFEPLEPHAHENTVERAQALREAAQVAYARLQRLDPASPVTLLASLERSLHNVFFLDEPRFEPRKMQAPERDQAPPRRCWPLQDTSLPELKPALERAREDWLRRLEGAEPLENEGLPDAAPLLASAARRKKLLLHVCCGPDAAGVLHTLKRDFDLVAFWYDPNIQPREEHDLRLAAFLKVAEIEGVPALVGEYDEERFLAAIKGLEHTPEKGAKCSNCYDLRLDRAAQEAKAQGCELFATTLAISPHKVQEKLVAFGQIAEKRHGVAYYHRDFKKGEGFNRSVELTREHGIYRQDYCGCLYSLHEGGPKARAKAVELGLAPKDIKLDVAAYEGG
jgi:predicted adenine nucleotide alpha hydrolase (AANH) superfamily ATPase